MTPSPSITQEKQDLSELYLEPAHVDCLSNKTQVVFAAILSSILVFAVYWPTLNAGFLHDDFLHLDYIARALLKGDMHDFLANLYSNWGGSDLMRSYRPLVSISLFLDFLFFKTNAWGFHLTNLLLTCGCCLFVALIASELSGPFGNRMRAATAIWAALLFAAYPLHVESVAWIIGRVDLLCTLFYLASLYYFLRWRLLEERPYLWLTAGCFALSLLSKEMAVTLPAVATVFALLIPARSEVSKTNAGTGFLFRIIRRPSKLEWQALGLLWLTLAVFAVIRTILLGSAIGGYGNAGFSQILASFANKAALLKIIAPANEEVLPLSKKFISIALIPYMGAAVFAGLRCLVTPALIRYFAAFALFAAIALLPTFQVWNIAPNLCGSRLFFLSSTALALTFAFAFIPNEDSIDRKAVKLVTVAGTIFLTFTLVLFAFLARANVTTFQEAGQMMRSLKQQLMSRQASPNEKMLVLNLPSDYRGAPMLTRPQYLMTMLSPPFSDRDVSSSISTGEMDLPCDHANYSADKLKEALSTANARNANFWSDAESKILPLPNSTGGSGFQCDFSDLTGSTISPKETQKLNGNIAHIFNSNSAQIEVLKNCARLYPGKHGLTAMLPIASANPLSTPLVKIKMTVSANQPAEQLLSLIRLTWDQDQYVISKNKLANLVQTEESVFECPLINNKEWLLGGNVKQVGLSLLPSPYYVTVESIEGIAADECVPDLSSPQKGSFQVYASKVRNAASILVLVSKGDTTFDTAVDGNVLHNYRNISVSADAKRLDSPDSSITGKMQHWIYLERIEGTFSLPQEVYNDGKNHQVVAIALDKNGKMVGLPSRVLKVK